MDFDRTGRSIFRFGEGQRHFDRAGRSSSEETRFPAHFDRLGRSVSVQACTSSMGRATRDTGTRMISDLFMCPRGEQRETYDAMLDTPPDSATRKKHGLLLLKGLDNLVLDQLAAMLRSPDWVLDPDADDIAEERFFFELGPGFVATLAAASHDQERLRKAAELWIEAWSADLATIPAFKGTLPTHMRPRLHGEGGWWPAVVDMAALAARAHAKGWSVYLVNVP